MEPTLECFNCENGTLRPVLETYEGAVHTTNNILENYTVENVPMLRCDCCGDTVIGNEGMKFIDRHRPLHARPFRNTRL